MLLFFLYRLFFNINNESYPISRSLGSMWFKVLYITFFFAFTNNYFNNELFLIRFSSISKFRVYVVKESFISAFQYVFISIVYGIIIDLIIGTSVFSYLLLSLLFLIIPLTCIASFINFSSTKYASFLLYILIIFLEVIISYVELDFKYLIMTVIPFLLNIDLVIEYLVHFNLMKLSYYLFSKSLAFYLAFESLLYLSRKRDDY